MGKKPWYRKNKRKPYSETNEKGVRKDYAPVALENEKFETFYKMQKICPDEEWDEFYALLKETLPTTFRVTGSGGQSDALRYIVEEELVKNLVKAANEDDDLDSIDKVKPTALPWYPGKLAWQVNLSRSAIRKNESYLKFHNFLISETSSGNISRQEAVSMIPPLALKVEPHHKVLDMAAAPGSKTCQLVEFLHKDTNKIPLGIVVANDMDNRRCYMLVHQVKRLQSPALIITNHDGRYYPTIYKSTDPNSSSKTAEKVPLKFDRILADVPCTGDGTARKNVDVWKKWGVYNGLYFHQTQYYILKRGLELLEVGGRIVYSTCSFNPYENEAVIHRMLKDCEGSIELEIIDLPHLKSKKGLSNWLICTNEDLTVIEKPEDIPKKYKNTIYHYHFPPSAEEAPKYNLDRCMRILPHHQDTGGFFIASLIKTKPLPWEKENIVVDATVESQDNEGELQLQPPESKKAKKMIGFKEDPFLFTTGEDDPVWKSLVEFYKLDTNFINRSNLMTRAKESKHKKIYYANDLVRDICQQNEQNLRIINTGIKVFARLDIKTAQCFYRLAQDGLKTLLPAIRARTCYLTKEDLVILLVNDDEKKPPSVDLLSSLAKNQISTQDNGSLLVIADIKEGFNGGPPFKLEVVGWKGNNSLRMYLAKDERVHYIRLCGGDVSAYELNKFKKNEEAPAAAEENEMDIDAKLDEIEDVKVKDETTIKP